jgi:hypothetical protein
VKHATQQDVEIKLLTHRLMTLRVAVSEVVFNAVSMTQIGVYCFADPAMVDDMMRAEEDEQENVMVGGLGETGDAGDGGDAAAE